MKWLSILAISIAIVTLGAGTASAFPLWQGNATEGGTQIEDDDLDFFVDNDKSGTVTVGDYLIAMIQGTALRDILLPTDPASPYSLNSATDELVAISYLQVIPSLATDPAGRERFGQIGTTPMLQIYSGSSEIDFDPSDLEQTLADAVNAVVDGDLLWAFSVTADPDTEWFFDPSAGLSAIPAIVAFGDPTTKFGIANFALNQVSGAPIFDSLLLDCKPFGVFACGGDGYVQLSGSADILGGGHDLSAGGNPFLEFDPNLNFATSDADIQLNPTSAVPEPSTLVLLGLGLLSAGIVSRRKF